MAVDPLTEQVVRDVDAVRAAGVAAGRQEAIQAYFGQSAIRLTVGIFATALHEAAARMGPLSPEAAQFFGEKAAEFAEFATPPAVTSVSPATDAANVQPGDQVVIGFSAPLDPASITDATVYVAASSGGPHLTGELQYDGARAVTFAPANGLSAGVQYTITVTKDLRTRLGQPLGGDYTSTFTVAGA